MTDSRSIVRNISDTARWVAYFRARETNRADALFHDPYAERLAGERGFHIAKSLPDGNKHEWAWVARTYLFDKFVGEEIQNGSDLVINLAAGLDTRPYRLDLPSDLHWIEVDFPEILSYKEAILVGERPVCRLKRIALDLTEISARRDFFAMVVEQTKRVTIISEGLLIYLTPQEVGSLATDLATESSILTWIVDLASPGQLRLMQRTTGKHLGDVGAAFKFGPPEGAKFFSKYHWEPKSVQGLMKTAAELNRLPPELHSLLPEPQEPQGNFPWTGVCLLRKH